MTNILRSKVINVTSAQKQTLLETENWNFMPLNLTALPWYSESDAPEGIPILDLHKLSSQTTPEIRKLSLQILQQAITESGFFYIKNHGISDEEIEFISNCTRNFYSHSEEFKMQFDHREESRGYSHYRLESTARFFGTGFGKDLCMKYSMGPELTPEEINERISGEEDIASKAYSANVYPNSEFKAAWINYYNRIHELSMQLLTYIGESLELDEAGQQIWKEILIEKSCGDLRYLQYPDVPKQACCDISGNLPDRMGAHFDWDVVTLLHQTPSQNKFISLEARIGENFVKVPAIRGTIVVNLGEVLRLLTRGKVKATIHRVVRPPQALHQGSARDVVVFFQAPPLNAKLSPLVFNNEIGQDTLFDQLYRDAKLTQSVTFSRLRARFFAEFIRQTRDPDAMHEQDAHLFSEPNEHP